jgi:hypothetical protein
VAFFYKNSNNVMRIRPITNDANAGGAASLAEAEGFSIPAGAIRMELTVNSLSATTSELTFTIYDSTGNVIHSISGTDSTPALQQAGQW